LTSNGVLWLLLGWTLASLGWWLIAVFLVVRAGRRHLRLPAASAHEPIDERAITIFKPLASPLSDTELRVVCECLESFVADMDTNCEMLIGGQPAERKALEAFVADMRDQHPAAHVRLIIAAQPETSMHPKVARNQQLSHYARGELWLWSDADILIEAGTIRSLRADALDHEGLVTSPYIVKQRACTAEMLDALFVNLEFYPGVELLGTLNAVPGAFGAGMLFEASAFSDRLDWYELGSHLAEDYVMGQYLGPVKLGSARVVTVPCTPDWRSALLHYLRWQKTIRWCQPLSFAAQLVILPILGWLGWLLFDPGNAYAWRGLAFVLIMDTLAGAAIFRMLGCRLTMRELLVLPLWSLLRGLIWLACWLPWPVAWRGRRWWAPKLYDAAGTAVPCQKDSVK